MISQLTVFLENKQGRLASMCETLAEGSINMHALFLSDTADFGIARIFCDHPDQAVELLKRAGLRASITPVIAVRVPNKPGGFLALLELCNKEGLNIEYSYCFLEGDHEAINVLKIDNDRTESVLRTGGFTLVEPYEIYEE